MTDRKINPSMDLPVIKDYEIEELSGGSFETPESEFESLEFDDVFTPPQDILLPPETVTFLSESITVTPDGKVVAEVFIEIPDAPGVDEYEVRMS